MTVSLPPNREELKAAYDEMLEEHDYDGNSAVLEVGFTALSAAKARFKTRQQMAIDKDPFTGQVFPLLTHEDELDTDSADYLLQKWLYREARKNLWATTNPLTGKLQELFAERTEFVVCRYGGLRGTSAYITDDPQAFRVDVIDSRGEQDVNRVAKLGQFYGATSKRIPNMATTIADAFDGWLIETLAVGRSYVPLLLEAGASDTDDES